VSDFVIMDDAKKVREIVTQPSTNRRDSPIHTRVKSMLFRNQHVEPWKAAKVRKGPLREPHRMARSAGSSVAQRSLYSHPGHTAYSHAGHTTARTRQS
jgi:hypothetical protein